MFCIVTIVELGRKELYTLVGLHRRNNAIHCRHLQYYNWYLFIWLEIRGIALWI